MTVRVTEMDNVSLIEQLDDAIEAIVASPGGTLPTVRENLDISSDPSIDELLGIAAELRDLPRRDFRSGLMTDLITTASTMKAEVKPMREGFHTITPYLIVHGAAGLIDFVKRAFGAEELYRGTGSAGGIHAEVKIQDSMLMIGGGETLSHPPTPTALHVYVKDADAVYERAVEAGAVSLHKPIDQPYGDREAGVKDQAGNHWYIATHKATGHTPEGLRAVTPYLHPRGAGEMIDFLKRAFGAEEQYRVQSPDGIVHHAVVKIGDSMIEMGEAHGQAQPMPTTFFMYVDDVDAWYDRAITAGADSCGTPADQPYGDRVGGVEDAFGNVWYLATRIKDASI